MSVGGSATTLLLFKGRSKDNGAGGAQGGRYLPYTYGEPRLPQKLYYWPQTRNQASSDSIQADAAIASRFVRKWWCGALQKCGDKE